MTIPIYNQNGQSIEFSDEGQGVKNIEGCINYQLFIKKLSARQLELLELKVDGYSLKEIALKLKISYPTAKREMSHIQRMYGII